MRLPYAKLAFRHLAARHLGRLFTVNFKVTERCNLTCPMCGIPRFGNRAKEMDIAAIRKTASILARLGVPRVVLTGGEPTLREDLEEIVRAFADKRILVTLLTNGTIAGEERLRRLLSAGVFAVGVSLDSLDADWQDEFCGASGTWQKAIKTLMLARRLLPKGVVYAMVTVTARNLEETPRLVDFIARETGAYTAISPVNLPVTADDERRLSVDAPSLRISGEAAAQVDPVYDKLLEMKRAGRPILVSSRFLEMSRAHMKGASPAWSCDAGILYINISSDGGVAPCNEFPAILNIQDADFLERFRSMSFKAAAKNQRDACKGCVFSCWREMSSLVKSYPVLIEQYRTLLRKPIGPKEDDEAPGSSSP